MIGKMFSTPKPRKFSIGTRYYDEDKENLEARKRQARAEMGLKDEDGLHIPNIKGQFRSSMPNVSKSASAERRKSNRRLLIIVAILCALVYFYIKFV